MNHLYSLLFPFLLSAPAAAQLPAFPGAEGFGALATGGRASRTVVHVTNLNATGPGSLAEALNGSNRIVVFDVGGIIRLSPSQMVSIDRHSNITVLGQTAPGDGITIYGNRVLIRNCSNVIFQYVRMRGSIRMARSGCTLTMDGAENVILDHCSISWGRWDNVHIKNANNITWQNCIIAEGIDPQRFGAITDGTRNWTISHCLWANNKSRNPKMKCYAQMVNSVVYNGGNGVVGGHSAADNYQDLVNNYFIAGPQGGSSYSQWTATDHLYQRGNLMDADRDGQLNGTPYTNTGCTDMDSPRHSPAVPVTVETPEAAYAAVLAQAGCSRVRDTHDLRLVNQLKSLGTEGRIIDSEEDVGGIGTLNGGQAPVDTDRDGIPDDWEKAHGLNPDDAADAVADAPDGYLWIEHYAHSLTAATSALAYPMDVKVTRLGGDATTAAVSWTNADDRATAVLLEMSTDGGPFVQIDSLPARSTFRTVTDLDPDKMYSFRLRTTDGQNRSAYSAVVSINEPEGMLPGGGTPADTEVLRPAEGRLYRIICYASRYFNSGANINGPAQYLTAGSHNGHTTLNATTNFDWQDPALLWSITQDAADPTRYSIRTYSRNLCLAPVMTDEYITLDSTLAASYNITFVGNYQPAQSGRKEPLAFFRINSPDNQGFQVRGRSASQWLWGSGTVVRADMIFTFQPVSTSLISPSTQIIATRADRSQAGMDGSQAWKDEVWYTLQGVRVSRPTHGIYIHQGRITVRR